MSGTLKPLLVFILVSKSDFNFLRFSHHIVPAILMDRGTHYSHQLKGKSKKSTLLSIFPFAPNL
jgi:hypothetical protein